MRTALAACEVDRPRSMGEALERMEEGWRPLAGGSELTLDLARGRASGGRFLDLEGLEELKGIRSEGAWTTLGALVTLADLGSDEGLASEFPGLRTAVRRRGGTALQNQATLGGSLLGSRPARDLSVVLAACGAEADLRSRSGERRVSLEALEACPGELLVAVRLPRPGVRTYHYFRRVPDRSCGEAKVSLALVAQVESGTAQRIRVVLGGVPGLVRARRVEGLLEGRPLENLSCPVLREALMEDIHPVTDGHSSERYRRTVALHLLEEALEGLAGG